jgi:hypothetical protein
VKGEALTSEGRLRHVAQHFRAAISRAVIHNDQFLIGQRLQADAANGFIKKSPGVVNRHHHTDSWDRHRSFRYQAGETALSEVRPTLCRREMDLNFYGADVVIV